MPERLDHFMARANAAYYAARDPFADFVTSPEITQMFGELLGAWAAAVWESMGSPARVILAEAGPGKGTLMKDALRLIARMAPAFAEAAAIWFIETSNRLREVQAQAVPTANFASTLAELPAGPVILLANEFLDALPIRQFRKTETGWRERFVEGPAFVELAGEPGSGTLPPTEPGDILEINESAREFVTALSARLQTQGGAALLIDYGPAKTAPGESLQALRNGKPADPLCSPGSADLTAHVDFQTLAAAAVPAAVHGPVPQGSFLSRLGLFQRAQALARGKEPRLAMQLLAAANRLADPTAMGSLFKALAITHPGLPQPAGFAG